MRRSTFFSLIVASAAIWLPDSASAFVLLSGTTTGTFDNFVLSGNVINTNSSLGFYDNTATNFSFGSGTSAMGWGTNPGTSTLTFTGKPFAVGLGQTFDIGTLTYFNGTSDLTSLIFGATLTLGAGAGVDPLAASFQIITTVNTGYSPARDADYILFDALPSTYLGSFEGATVNFELYGRIVDDPMMTFDFALLPGDQPGVIAPGIPELSSWAMMLIGFGGAALRLHRRDTSSAAV